MVAGTTMRQAMVYRRILLALVLAFGASGPAAAGPFEDGVAAYRGGDYATALRLWRPLAEQGNAGAQSNLGVMYAKGQGVPRDYAQATQWYRKAADQGDADAQFSLGSMYDRGRRGRGVPQDFAQAAQWYRKAAEQGVVGAQFNLGFMYANGRGVPQDYVLAHMWSNLAAGGFPATDTEKRNLAVANRDAVTARMTPAQIAEAQRLAREWRPTAEK
jgi:TPR repeat protein